MANNLAPLTKRRSFGFQGEEGEMFDENNQLPGNALVPLITNESIGQNPTPQNYIQRTGGPMINLDYLNKPSLVRHSNLQAPRTITRVVCINKPFSPA